MKIGIDTFGCNHSKSGNGSYLLNFIKNLQPLPDFTFELFGFESDRYTYKSNAEISFVSVDIKDNPKAEKKWHKSKINLFVKKQGYDAVLFPAADKVLPSKFKNYKGIAIVNSILSNHNKKDESNSLHHLIKSLKSTDVIIAATNFIKEDMIKIGVPEDKIKVIYNGIEHKLFFPALDHDSEFVEVRPFAIKKPYFIYGSSLSGPDKKHIELIKAFELFKKITGSPHRLVISGTDDEYAKKIHEVAYESEYASDIFLTGYFPHDSFAKMYAEASACIFPATKEGIGLPVLEAMACGIPVLASDSGALKEVGGDAPIYFNSDNIPELADCMAKIIKNTDDIHEMIVKGLIRAKEFSWEKTVEQTLQLLK